MITYSNTIEHKDIPFEQYLKLGGYSHSWLKNEQNGVKPLFVVSDKMRIGSMVDAFLTQPEGIKPSDPFYEVGRQIAIEIKQKFGSIIKYLEPQISYTSTAEFNGLQMPITGRLDWLLRGQAVVDLKVTSATDLKTLIKFMGYENQMFNYMGMANVKTSYNLAYSTKLGKCLPLIEIPKTERNEFWESKIMKFGTIC